MDAPRHLHLDQQTGLDVVWADGTASHYPVAHLRRWSPSAEARAARADLERNPLAVLPQQAKSPETLEAVGIERVGSYAVRIEFNDGHRTGLYSWEWLCHIDPARMDSNP
ncbi:MAG: DUF971 domain-containing protein [Phycisphaerales bacterium]|nr:DUF971 domain-containing protein [Phycisphaerales bacterium]